MENKTTQVQRRKGIGLEELLPAVVAFVLIAIVGAVGALILQNFGASSSIGNTCYGTNTISTTTGLCSGTLGFLTQSVAYNAIQYGVSGTNTFMSYLPLIALVIVASILIGIVLVAFAFGGTRKAETF